MKSFVSVSNFTNDPSVSATHCQLPFQGSLKPSHFITLNLRTRHAVSLQRVLRNHKSRDKTHRIRVPEKAAPVELSWSRLIRKRFRNAFFFSPAFSVWRFLWKRGISLKILAFHRLSTENFRFSTPFSTSCGKPMWRKNFAATRDFPDASSAAVESPVEGCAKAFPQAVETAAGICRIFHGFLHKFFVSTPQSFHHSTRKKSLHFSTISPQRVRGRKISADSGKKTAFHFSCPSITATNFFILLISIFCSFAAFLIKNPFPQDTCCGKRSQSANLSDKRMDRPC